MLAVGHKDREPEQHREGEQQQDGLEDLVGVFAKSVERRGKPLRREGTLEELQRRVGRAREFVDPLCVDRRTPVGKQRPDDVEDHEQHEPRRPEVGTKESAPTTQPGGGFLDPDDDERGDGGDTQHREEVFDEPKPRVVAENRNLELRVDQPAKRLKYREEQNHEPPEDREVRDPWAGPLEQLLLGRHLDELGLDGRAQVEVVLRPGGLARPPDLVEEEQPSASNTKAANSEKQAEDCADGHHRVVLSFASRVCRDLCGRSALALGHLVDQGGEDGVQVTDDTEVRDLEHRRLGVLVDHDDRLAALHASAVLDGA